MSLAEVDMQSCDKKERCLSGPNAGLAYLPGGECPAGSEFNTETCDCDSVINETCMLYKVSWTVDRSGYAVCAGNVSYDCNNVGVAGREAIVACYYGAPYFREVSEQGWDFGASTTFPGCGFPITSQGTYKVLQLVADDANGNYQTVRSTYDGPIEIYDPVYAKREAGGGCTVYDWDVYSDVTIEELCELNYPCIACGMDNNSIGTHCKACPCDDAAQTRDDSCTCQDFAQSFTVYYTEQQHDTQPCAGIVADPCDEGGACPTNLVSGSKTVTIEGQTTRFRIDTFQEYQAYGTTNSRCPANVKPSGETWADVFGVDNVYDGSTSGDASASESFPSSNSLWAICTDENGETWAILVAEVWGGSVASTYRAGGYTSISVAAGPY